MARTKHDSPLTAGVNRSGSITTGGTSQLVAAANTNRLALDYQNISDETMWITEHLTTAAADTAGCWKLDPGDCWYATTNRAVYVVSATTGKKFTCTEMG